MLKTRVLTALVLLPAAFVLVFLIPPAGFAAAAATLLLVGAWEFRRLAAIEASPAGWALLAIQAGLFSLFMLDPERWMTGSSGHFMVACIAWLLMFAQLNFYRPAYTPGRAYRVRSFVNALAVLTFAWLALAWLRSQPAGEWWLLVLLLVIWAADTGAYFAGRRFGRRKLAPNISPGKTVAGLWGGLLLAPLVAVAAVALIPELNAGIAVTALIALVTALASAGGDLFISMHKRTVGCKDSGRVFPGHGGVLDRLDSLMAGAPFFAFGKLLAGI